MGSDPESYLRRLAERALLADRLLRREGEPTVPLVEQAAALVAVGALPMPAAQRVVDDYGAANARRGRGGFIWRVHLARTRDREAPEFPPSEFPQPVERVVFTGASFERSWGRLRVRYLALGGGETLLAASMTTTRPLPIERGATNPPTARSRTDVTPTGWPPTLTVADDRGTGIDVDFEEFGHVFPTDPDAPGGVTSAWEGRFHYPHDVLATDTAWLRLCGRRVAVTAPMAGVEVRVDEVTSGDRVEAYLRHCVEMSAEGPRRVGDTVGNALDALVGCGVLDADSGLVAETLAAADAVSAADRPARSFRPPGGTATERDVGEPGRSLRDRAGFHHGPVGELRIGAITGVFGDVRVTVCDLRSEGAGFRVGVLLDGVAAGFDHLDVARACWPVTFTATDDLGNPYCGAWANSLTSVRRQHGTVRFRPGLDPDARRLDIAISSGLARAVVRVPLDRGA